MERTLSSGVPPNSEVTLQATRTVAETTGGQRAYSAQALFKADAQGRVDLATQLPLSGSYSGADLRGLFWSMVPAKDAAGPPLQKVLLQARRADGMLLAEQTVQLRPFSPLVQQRKAEPFAGAVFATAMVGHLAISSPGIVLLVWFRLCRLRLQWPRLLVKSRRRPPGSSRQLRLRPSSES